MEITDVTVHRQWQPFASGTYTCSGGVDGLAVVLRAHADHLVDGITIKIGHRRGRRRGTRRTADEVWMTAQG